MRAARITLIAAGALLMGYAAAGVLTDPDVKPVGVAVFLAAVLVAHDGVLLPLIIGAGALITRWVPARARTPVRLAGLATVAVTLIAAPLVVGAGRSADNPSVLPRPYPLGLLLVLTVIWLTALLVPALRRLLRMRGGKGTERTSGAMGG